MNPLPPTNSLTGAAVMAAASPVLDVEDGLDRILGDRPLYFKLLRRFQHDHQPTMALLREALGADRYMAAQLKSHTLKGAAGMIGARALHGCAAELESALRAQAPAAHLPLQQVEQALDQVLSTIASILSEQAEEALAGAGADAAPARREPATQALIVKLAFFLQEGDGAAIDLLENSASALAAGLGLGVFQQVAAAAHEFDFEAALQALEQPG